MHTQIKSLELRYGHLAEDLPLDIGQRSQRCILQGYTPIPRACPGAFSLRQKRDRIDISRLYPFVILKTFLLDSDLEFSARVTRHEKRRESRNVRDLAESEGFPNAKFNSMISTPSSLSCDDLFKLILSCKIRGIEIYGFVAEINHSFCYLHPSLPYELINFDFDGGSTTSTDITSTLFVNIYTFVDTCHKN